MRHRICEKCGNNGFTTPAYTKTAYGFEVLRSHCLSCGYTIGEPCKDAKSKKPRLCP